MKILLIGSSSFVAQGFCGSTQSLQHDLLLFKRGAGASSETVLKGDLSSLAQHAGLVKACDVVVNFAVLKDRSIEENIKAIEGILKFCRETGVKNFIHISSISVYDTKTSVVDETSPLPADPLSKGAYASIKIAVDQYLETQTIAPDLKIALIRPGFVLGPGIANPFPGIGIRLPCNRLLLFGSGRVHLPLVSRDFVHRMIHRLFEHTQSKPVEVFHCFDATFLNRRTYLKTCNDVLGVSKKVICLPGLFWYLAGFAIDSLLRVAGIGPKVMRSIKNSCSGQRYTAEATERELGISEKLDLKTTLTEIMTGQDQGYHLFPIPEDTHAQPANLNFIGCGRIFKSAHLHALSLLGWDHKKIQCFDVAGREEAFGRVQEISQFSAVPNSVHIVASPAVYHVDAAKLLLTGPGICMVEKPLALGPSEWAVWKDLQTQDVTVGIFHNYRFKKNTRKMRKFLKTYPSGKLLGAHLLFQSPPVRNDDSPWIRDERKSRSLLMDYSIHFLDLLCMFSTKSWRADSIQHTIDLNGDTSVIQGVCSSEDYPATFHLQQGFGPRTCRIEYVFQNYTCVLSFFPDSFTARMSNNGAGSDWLSTLSSTKATVSKIAEKVSKKPSDGSHAYCYRAILADGSSSEIGMDQLESFYQLLFEISDQVYEETP